MEGVYSLSALTTLTDYVHDHCNHFLDNLWSLLLYLMHQVGCKALIMADTHKTQDYYQMMCNVARELSSSKPGDLLSEKSVNIKLHCFAIIQT